MASGDIKEVQLRRLFRQKLEIRDGIYISSGWSLNVVTIKYLAYLEFCHRCKVSERLEFGGGTWQQLELWALKCTLDIAHNKGRLQLIAKHW